MSESLKHDIHIECDADYKADFQLSEDDEKTIIDMTGWTAQAQLREYPEAIEYLPFACTADETGIHITMAHENTAKISYTRGHYDVFITDPDGGRTKLIKGRAYIYPRAVR